MKVLGFGAALAVFILVFSGCSDKGVQTWDAKKPRVFRRSKLKNNATQSTTFHRDGELHIVSQQGQKKNHIEYERADIPEKRAQGLMFRTSMEENQGMLFIFEESAPMYFFMKNTYIPLDILFMDNEKKIIKIYRNTKPQSEELLPSVADARFALEVCAGFCERHGIIEGDLVEF